MSSGALSGFVGSPTVVPDGLYRAAVIGTIDDANLALDSEPYDAVCDGAMYTAVDLMFGFEIREYND